MLVLEYARELGLPMRGLAQHRHIGWTTSERKADTMRGLAYTVVVVSDEGEAVVESKPQVQASIATRWGSGEHDRFNGWDVSFPVGAKVAA